MSRRLLLVLAVALLASSCANEQLGRRVPGCVEDLATALEVTGGIVLQMQAVETAEYVPCITLLPPGWDYEHLVPERGESRFWLHSDRVGTRFLEVTLRDRCDVAGLEEVSPSEDGVQRFASTTVVPTTVTVTIIPISGREIDFARFVEAAIEEEELSGRRPFAVMDRQDVPLADRIAEAHDKGQAVVVIGERDVISATAALLLPGDEELRRGLEIPHVLDLLDGGLPEPSLEGTWVDVFEGGCVVYEFDAHGPGAERLEEEVDRALGLFPAEDLREILTDQGMLG